MKNALHEARECLKSAIQKHLGDAFSLFIKIPKHGMTLTALGFNEMDKL